MPMSVLSGAAFLVALFFTTHFASVALRRHAHRTGDRAPLLAGRALDTLPSLLLAAFAFPDPLPRVLVVLAAAAWHATRLREELKALHSAEATLARLFPVAEQALWTGEFVVGERRIRVELGGLSDTVGEPHWMRAALGSGPCPPPTLAAQGPLEDSLATRVWCAGEVASRLAAEPWIFVHDGAVRGRLPQAELSAIVEDRAKALAGVVAAMEASAADAVRRFTTLATRPGPGRRQAWLDLEVVAPETLREIAPGGLDDPDDRVAAIAATHLDDRGRIAALLARSADLAALERLTRWAKESGRSTSQLATVALQRAAREQTGLGPELVAFAAASLADAEHAAVVALSLLDEDSAVAPDVAAPARAVLARLRAARRGALGGGLAVVEGGEVSVAGGGEVSPARETVGTTGS